MTDIVTGSAREISKISVPNVGEFSTSLSKDSTGKVSIDRSLNANILGIISATGTAQEITSSATGPGLGGKISVQAGTPVGLVGKASAGLSVSYSATEKEREKGVRVNNALVIRASE
jgi:hypothetical protein